MKLRCPHCKAWAHVRSSTQVTPLLREKYLVCSNPACGHAFAAATEINRTLSPSAIPDPRINLPFSAHVKRRDIAEQLRYQPVSPKTALPPADGVHLEADPATAETVTDGPTQAGASALANG